MTKTPIGCLISDWSRFRCFKTARY